MGIFVSVCIGGGEGGDARLSTELFFCPVTIESFFLTLSIVKTLSKLNKGVSMVLSLCISGTENFVSSYTDMLCLLWHVFHNTMSPKHTSDRFKCR